MCGIAGIWNRDRRPVENELLREVTDRMTHRGPDAAGYYLDSDLGLGHRRLSIIDIEHSQQPMHNEHGLSIVYNGELYNFRELRSELTSRGHRFRTSGDTEVILSAFAEWGVECLPRFRGMFAFAIWDGNKRELFLARDRFGIKPLCLCRHRDGVAFASEVEAFSGLGNGFKKDLSPEALDQYLYYGYIPAPGAIFNNVSKLPPAHYCRLREPDDAFEFVRYWQLEFRPDSSLDNEQWTEGLKERVNDAVKSHMVADVPVGAFLSGGIDSSVVVAAMSQTTDSMVKAYTIGFSDAAFDERSITRQSSSMIPIHYHEEELQLDVLDTLDLLVKRYGEPFADSSAVCTYRVTENAARDVKVMLSGDGGDEVFGGYSHYGWMLSQFQQTFLPMMKLRLAVTDMMRGVRLLGKRTTPLDAWKGRNECFSEALRVQLWKPQYREIPGATEDFLNRRFRCLNQVNGESFVDSVQTLEISDYLVYNNLHKVDIASMCHGLEVRVPLLDQDLVEFAVRIPWKQRIRPLPPDRPAEAAMFGYVHKYPLRWLAEQTFGRGFFDRRKMGFTMPISSWLVSNEIFPMLRESLIGKQSPLLNYFRREPMERLLSEHRERQNHGQKLWSLLFFSKWMKYHQI